MTNSIPQTNTHIPTGADRFAAVTVPEDEQAASSSDATTGLDVLHWDDVPSSRSFSTSVPSSRSRHKHDDVYTN